MRNQLIEYVNLLFAGAPEAEDIKQEILQNTLDRYDDLIAEGKVPAAAYRLAISGIGDINDLLGRPEETPQPLPPKPHESEKKSVNSSLARGIAIAFYILCPVPLFILGNEIGLSIMLILIAGATALLVICRQDKSEHSSARSREADSPHSSLRKAVKSCIGILGLCVYLVLSFATGAWYITWLVFPLMACCQGLARAIFDLKEAQ